MNFYIPGAGDRSIESNPNIPSMKDLLYRGIRFIAVDQDQTEHPNAEILAYGGRESALRISILNKVFDQDLTSRLEITTYGITAYNRYKDSDGTFQTSAIIDATAAYPIKGRDIKYLNEQMELALKQVAITHGTDPNVTRPTAETVTWIGTVEPVNLAAADIWIEPQTTNS